MYDTLITGATIIDGSGSRPYNANVALFGDRIVFIGSGITNGSSYPTETTLYQLRLDDRAAEVDINEDWFDSFPLNYRFASGGQAVVTDIKGNVYILPDGTGLNVVKQTQTSPSDTRKKEGTGDFVTAYIDHGVSPENASYEYMMLVGPSMKDVNRFSKNLPYTVIRRDNDAHVVNDHITGITAYICYKAYDGSASADAFAALPGGKEAKPYLPVSSIDAEAIVMERTREDGLAVVSICTPDLGITQKAYTTPQPSQVLQKKMVVDGDWELAASAGNVQLASEAGKTVLTALCVDGRPVEFTLKRL